MLFGFAFVGKQRKCSFEHEPGQNGQPRSQADQPTRPKANYTGERLARERRKIYRQIIELLAQGTSVNRIARQCAVSRHTVRAVRECEAVPIAQRKQEILATFIRIAEMGTEAIEDELAAGKIKGALLVPVTGMATDKVIALSNEPARIEVNVAQSDPAGPSLFERLEALARALNERAERDAKVIDAPVEPPGAQRALPDGETVRDSGAETGSKPEEQTR